jgi:hypothetical protein
VNDQILASFLEAQEVEAMELARENELFDLIPVGSRPYQRFIVRYHCKGLVRTPDGITEANLFELGVYMPSDYLRRINPAEVLTWLGPPETFMPNIMYPFVCAGRLNPGTSLVEIIQQCFEIACGQRITMREDDALNPVACAYARKNADRFPIDDRPLVKRRSGLRFKETTQNRGQNDGQDTL